MEINWYNSDKVLLVIDSSEYIALLQCLNFAELSTGSTTFMPFLKDFQDKMLVSIEDRDELKREER